MQVDPGDVLAFNSGVYMKDSCIVCKYYKSSICTNKFPSHVFSKELCLKLKALKDIIFCDMMTNPCPFYLLCKLFEMVMVHIHHVMFD